MKYLAVAVFCFLAIQTTVSAFSYDILYDDPSISLYNTQRAQLTKSFKELAAFTKSFKTSSLASVIHSHKTFALQDTSSNVSDKCTSSLSALANGPLLTCLSTVDNIFKNGSREDLVNTTNHYCNAADPQSCFNVLTKVIDDVVANCTADDLAALNIDGAGIKNLTFALRFPCIKDGDTLCAPTLWDIQHLSLSLDQPNNLTEAQIINIASGVCNNCTRKLFNALAQTQNAENLQRFEDIVCMKDEGKFCLPSFFKFHTIGENMTAALGVFCEDRCAATYLRVINDDNSKGMDFTLMCDKSPDGKYCMVKIQSYFSDDSPISVGCSSVFGDESGSAPAPINGTGSTSGSASGNFSGSGSGSSSSSSNEDIFPYIPPNATCPANCSTGLKVAFGELGCCVGSYLRAGFLLNGGNGSVLDTPFVKFLKEQCDAQIDAPCSAGYKIKGVLKVRNLRYSYYLENKEQVKSALTRDLANFAKVKPAYVTINAITEFTGQSNSEGFSMMSLVNKVSLLASNLPGLSVDYSVLAISQNDATVTTQNLASALSATDIAFPSLSTLPERAKVDPASSFAADQSSASSISQQDDPSPFSSAHSVQSLSVFVAAFIFIITVFFRY